MRTSPTHDRRRWPLQRKSLQRWLRPQRWSSTLRRALVIAAGLVVIALPALDVLAQSTGGSFGGGDWGSGGGGGGGGGGYGGGSHHDDDSGFFLIQLVFLAFRIHPLFGLLVLVVGIGFLIARSTGRGRPSSWGSGSSNPSSSPQPFVFSSPTAPGSRGWMNADVTQIRIALDVSARPAIEAALTSMMQSVNVTTRHGLLTVVHRVAGLLREHERAWRLAGETNYHPMSPPQASGVFSQLAAAGRAKAGQMTSSTTAPDSVFFVTLLVAAKREIVDFQAHRPEQIRMVLDDLMRLGEHDLVACEAYWLPLASGMGMPIDEVRRMHPDMKEVQFAGGAVGAAFAPTGATSFCPFCGKPRRAGPRCEHCGAA